jgi:hypothetical protein
MALAAASSLRAGKSRPRSRRSARWRNILKLSAGCLAIVVAGCGLCTTALAGLGWLVAVSPEARMDFRPVARTTPVEHLARVRSSRRELASLPAVVGILSIRETAVRSGIGERSDAVLWPAKAGHDKRDTSTLAKKV